MTNTPESPTAEQAAWDAMVRAVHVWASHHMDQFETFRFNTTPGGGLQSLPVYVTITHTVHDPDGLRWGKVQEVSA